MVSDEKWQDRARRLLKAELARQDIGYKELVEKLAKIGVKDTPQNIANKLSRGGFSAAYLLQCLHAIGCKDIRIVWDDE
jgi:3-mercaptopyruvate sulfurtransferase SseA